MSEIWTSPDFTPLAGLRDPDKVKNLILLHKQKIVYDENGALVWISALGLTKKEFGFWHFPDFGCPDFGVPLYFLDD